METDLRSLIVGEPTVLALINHGPTDVGVFWSSIPQAAADPNVVLYKITGAPGLHMGGSDGLESSLVQMNIRAPTYASMIAVRNALVDLLHGFRGEKGETEFQLISLRDERQSSEKPGTVLYFTDQLDFDIWSRDAA